MFHSRNSFREQLPGVTRTDRRRDVRLEPILLAGLLMLLGGPASKQILAQDSAETTRRPAAAPHPQSGKEGTSLFDGKTLAGWKVTQFGGQGDVWIEDGRLMLGFGNDLTGVTSTRDDLPRVNYEVSLEAMRVEGSDFFCGLTVPVREDESCSLIVGGWGGGVCGISCINGFDASENATTTYREFENKRWYSIRLRVTAERITAWLDGEKLVDQDIRDRKLSVRVEVELSKPFGFAAWRTKAALRNIRLRKLDPEELAAGEDADSP